MPLQLRMAREQIKSPFQSRAQEREQTKSQSARCARALLTRKVAPQFLFHDQRQTPQASLRWLKVPAPQTFLRPINARRPTRAGQGILHVHSHRQVLKPPLASRRPNAFERVQSGPPLNL